MISDSPNLRKTNLMSVLLRDFAAIVQVYNRDYAATEGRDLCTVTGTSVVFCPALVSFHTYLPWGPIIVMNLWFRTFYVKILRTNICSSTVHVDECLMSTRCQDLHWSLFARCSREFCLSNAMNLFTPIFPSDWLQLYIIYICVCVCVCIYISYAYTSLLWLNRNLCAMPWQGHRWPSSCSSAIVW